MPDYDPIPVLQSVGYTEREATFLYLVALYSGYFLRRQYDRFIRRGRGAIAEQLLRRPRRLVISRASPAGRLALFTTSHRSRCTKQSGWLLRSIAG